jgi:VanZ family protein
VSRWRWLAPLCVVVGILVITSLPHPPAMPGQSDKLVHGGAYALLGASVAWAALPQSFKTVAVLAMLVSLFGAVDEWHQQFIPNRSMDTRDWLADTIGGSLGLTLMTTLRRRQEHMA